MGNASWDSFGYKSDKGCDICDKKPAKLEPRFLYRACEEHSILSPVKFQEKRRELENGTR